MKKSPNLLFIIFGVIVGIWTFISLPTFFVFILCLVSLLFLWRFRSLEERKFLLIIFVLAISMRITLSIVNDNLGWIAKWDSNPIWNIDVVPDGNAYSRNAANIAWFSLDYLKSSLPNFFYSHNVVIRLSDAFQRTRKFAFIRTFEGILPSLGYRVDGYVHFIAFLYTLLGYSSLMMKLLNSLLGVCSCFLIYTMTKDIFGIKTAKLSLILTIFFPSILFWSIAGLKDIPVLFLTAVILWSAIKLSKSFKFLYVVLIFFALAALTTIKAFISIPLILLFVFLGLLFSKFFFIRKWLLLIFILSLSFMFFQYNQFIPGMHRDFSIKGVIHQQIAYTEKGIGYKIYPERFYQVGGGYVEPIKPIELFISYLNGILHTLLEPFPWSISSKWILLSYPQNILWYLLLPFSFLGMLIGLRYRFKECFIIISSVFLIISIFALTQGNIGTVFRHRDLVTPFCLMFSAAGIMKVVGKIKMLRPRDSFQEEF